MARLLFWGQQGLKRNLQAAVEYYRMGAEKQDPTSMYDYGIVLLKVNIKGTISKKIKIIPGTKWS